MPKTLDMAATDHEDLQLQPALGAAASASDGGLLVHRVDLAATDSPSAKKNSSFDIERQYGCWRAEHEQEGERQSAEERDSQPTDVQLSVGLESTGSAVNRIASSPECSPDDKLTRSSKQHRREEEDIPLANASASALSMSAPSPAISASASDEDVELDADEDEDELSASSASEAVSKLTTNPGHNKQKQVCFDVQAREEKRRQREKRKREAFY